MAYAVIGAEVGLRMGPAANALDMPENLWRALSVAREVKFQGEQDASARAAGKPVPMRTYNEDSEDLAGEHA